MPQKKYSGRCVEEQIIYAEPDCFPRRIKVNIITEFTIPHVGRDSFLIAKSHPVF